MEAFVDHDIPAAPLVPQTRSLTSYLSNYTDVPGQTKLQTAKNRLGSLRSNLKKRLKPSIIMIAKYKMQICVY